MFQQMRKKDRELSRPEAEKILANGLYGVLSMGAGDDYGYGVPLSYVYQDDCIYLHCALEGKKLEYLRRNNKVSFCVVGGAEPLPNKYSMKYQSAMAFGKVVEIQNNEEKVNILIDLVEKYYSDPDHIEKGREVAANFASKTMVLRLDIDHLTGKARN
ncbi:MAG: pyridoxamine 5'-phosphate oxidase family protein [Deltaproteobacteria bacterium]|nr:pyridoxamine 5'-phosphate oxidase family protein [Deltaproteobacteria bacterium]